jgi:DNA modification methylase
MSWRIENSDALSLLRELPCEWAQTCVTSPPYWGLRDYGLPPATWGGNPKCRHSWGAMQRGRRGDLLPSCETRSQSRLGIDERQGRAGVQGGRFCERCGAWRGCLGLEPTPELYVEHLVTVLDEVHRVLRSDGTLWLNLGDSYTSGGRSSRAADPMLPSRGMSERPATPPGLKPKDLVGVPWRVAFALQERGWWLRSDVIWVKPNPMPENVRDRPTRAHEYLFLLTKQPRYFYDADAVREPDSNRCSGNGYARRGRLTYLDRRGERGQHEQWRGGKGRQRRSWWKVTGRGYPGAQAVFPEKLVEPCILAGTAPTACGICGAPWQRERTTPLGEEGVWTPRCSHQNDAGRCLVLDPFCGSATTGAVAHRLGRNFLGVELGRDTARLARRRLQEITPEVKL